MKNFYEWLQLREASEQKQQLLQQYAHLSDEQLLREAWLADLWAAIKQVASKRPDLHSQLVSLYKMAQRGGWSAVFQLVALLQQAGADPSLMPQLPSHLSGGPSPDPAQPQYIMQIMPKETSKREV